MWELSKNHCCATCIYSRRPGCIVYANCPHQRTGLVNPEDLFPLNANLLCAYHREDLGQKSVQAVLVRPDGRCEGYECHVDRYQFLHGALPAEEEELYGLNLPEAFSVSSNFSGLEAGI